MKAAKAIIRAIKIRFHGAKGAGGERAAKKHVANESLRRELFARTVAAPALKKAFSGRLKAVLIYGSSQHGVRLASRKRKGSDLDLVAVLGKGSIKAGGENLPTIGIKQSAPLRKIYWAGKAAGIKVSIIACDETMFRAGTPEAMENNPYQVLLGQEWVVQNTPEKAAEANRKGKQSYYAKWQGWKDYR